MNSKKVKALTLLNLRMTDAEKANLKKDAYKHMMNVSEYIRYLINKARDEQEQEQE